MKLPAKAMSEDWLTHAMLALVGMLLAALVTAALCKCEVNPAALAPVPGNPCGNVESPCLDMAGNLNGACCPKNQTCGGGKYSIGCPEGECCFVGTPPAFLRYGDSGIVEDRDAGVVIVIKGPQQRAAP